MVIKEMSFVSASKLLKKFDEFVIAMAVAHRTETFTVELMRTEQWCVRNTKNGVIITHTKSNKSVYIANEDYAVIMM